MGINRVEFWPPNSLDLYSIENIFDYFKTHTDDYEPANSGYCERQQAGIFLEHFWKYRMDGIVQHLALSFKDKLELYLAHHSQNNYWA